MTSIRPRVTEEPVDGLAGTSVFAIDRSATCQTIQINLFAFVIVDRFARITGLIQVGGRHTVGLAGIPEVVVSGPGDRSLVPLSSHALPHGSMAWLSWLFERPSAIGGRYEARIDHVDLTTGGTGRPVESREGPWIFPFTLARDRRAT